MWQQIICHDLEYVIHVSLLNIYISCHKNNDIFTCARSTMTKYQNRKLRFCQVSLDIINPFNLFNIYNLKISLPYMAHNTYFIFMEAHQQHVSMPQHLPT